MKTLVEKLLATALDALDIDRTARDGVVVERTRSAEHGDYATNAALILSRQFGEKPREFAKRIRASLPESRSIEKVEIAGPGFLNFFLAPAAYHDELALILAAGERYGRGKPDVAQRVMVEFVSTNPTGPLHVGHGRNAAYGDSIARLLEATGRNVYREYYVNDAGRQADILAVSVWLAILRRHGEPAPEPAAAYPGEYIEHCAEVISAAGSERFLKPWAKICHDLPADAPEGDKEAYMDALIRHAKALLGIDYLHLRRTALDSQLAAIRATLDRFNVRFDNWFSEESLLAHGEVEDAIAQLSARGHTYEKDGALWLRTTSFGDEKDRVLRRSDGNSTYFASDVAYHLDKLTRGFDLLIDVWGADHHGYIKRVRAALEALTGRSNVFEVRLIQFVTLSTGRMGKRSGNYVTLDELVTEAGTDATRFFYLARSNDQHLEFDVELARTQKSDNPVYYVQYAHARVTSVFRQLAERNLSWDPSRARSSLGLLRERQEIALITELAHFPEVLATAANQRAPHVVAHYLGGVAQLFHVWYNNCTFLVEYAELRDARLALAHAARLIIANGLGLLGVSAPERM